VVSFKHGHVVVDMVAVVRRLCLRGAGEVKGNSYTSHIVGIFCQCIIFSQRSGETPALADPKSPATSIIS
jgi:hypothetical protein